MSSQSPLVARGTASRPRTVVARRTETRPPETEEIRSLCESAGHHVVGEVTQHRPPDPDTELGAGAVDRLASLVRTSDADHVVVDNDLAPGQAFSLAAALPEGVDVVDRRRLVIELFREGVGSREARLQLRLAELEYELPRLRAAIRRDEATEYTIRDEEGKPIEDHRRQIDEIRRQLAELDDGEQRRARVTRRREAGFAHVALAGYTNAGKSTLLRRLADDLAVGAGEQHTAGVSVEDRLFETLGTTTRRATIDGRRTLLTDTVGFVSRLPTALIEAFEATLDAVEHADLVVLVVDACAPIDRVVERVNTTRDHLPADATVLPVFTKADRVDEERLQEVVERVPTDRSPSVVSATDGDGIDTLRGRIQELLPARRATLTLPVDDDGMALLSWCHDHAVVEDVSYGSDTVTFTVEGTAPVVETARGRAERQGS